MVKTGKVIGTGAALTVVAWAATSPSEAIPHCDLDSHIGMRICISEPYDLPHGDDRDPQGPQAQRNLSVAASTASTESRFDTRIFTITAGTSSPS